MASKIPHRRKRSMVEGRSPMPAPTSWISLACSYTVTSAPCRLRPLATAAPPYPAPTTAIFRFVMSMAVLLSVRREGQELGRVLDEDPVDGVLVDPLLPQVGDQLLVDVVDGVALDAGPAQGAAVGVGGGEHLVEVALADQAQKVLEALAAVPAPERRVGQLEVVAEGVEADPAAAAPDRLLVHPALADAVVGVPEQHAVQRQALFGEDRERGLDVDGEVGEDRHPGEERSAGGRAVDPEVEVLHTKSAADPDLDDPGPAASGADAHGDLVHELAHQVVD